MIALRLGWIAQRVHRHSLKTVLRQALGVKIPDQVSTDQAVCATRRAIKYLGKAKLLNSCIVKSIIVGALCAKQHSVALHIGFKQKPNAQCEDVLGHAWVTVNSIDVLNEQKDYPAITTLNIERLSSELD